MCKGGSSTTTQNNGPPQVYQDAYKQLTGAASQVANKPLQQYTGSTVAGFSPDQLQAFSNINNVGNVGQPFTNASLGYVQQGAAPISGLIPTMSPGDVQGLAGNAQGWLSGSTAPTNIPQFSQGAVDQFQSPYTQDVLNSTLANINQQNSVQQNQLRGNAISSGAFGGDRAGVAAAELARNQDLAKNQTIAGIENQGYTQALGEFNTEQQQQIQAQQNEAARKAQAAQLGFGTFAGQQGEALNAAQSDAWRAANAGQQVAQLGQQTFGQDLTSAQAQEGIGSLEQQQMQQNLNVPYYNFQQQQAYPFQTLGWLGNIVEGLGGASGGSSTTTGPAPSGLSQGLGAGAAIAGGLGQSGAFGNNGWLSNLFSGPAAPADPVSGIASVGGWTGIKSGGRIGRAAGGLVPGSSYREGLAFGGQPWGDVPGLTADGIPGVSTAPGGGGGIGSYGGIDTFGGTQAHGSTSSTTKTSPNFLQMAMDAAKIAAMFAKSGGRIGYDNGGATHGFAQGDDSLTGTDWPGLDMYSLAGLSKPYASPPVDDKLIPASGMLPDRPAWNDSDINKLATGLDTQKIAHGLVDRGKAAEIQLMARKAKMRGIEGDPHERDVAKYLNSIVGYDNAAHGMNVGLARLRDSGMGQQQVSDGYAPDYEAPGVGYDSGGSVTNQIMGSLLGGLGLGSVFGKGNKPKATAPTANPLGNFDVNNLVPQNLQSSNPANVVPSYSQMLSGMPAPTNGGVPSNLTSILQSQHHADGGTVEAEGMTLGKDAPREPTWFEQRFNGNLSALRKGYDGGGATMPSVTDSILGDEPWNPGPVNDYGDDTPYEGVPKLLAAPPQHPAHIPSWSPPHADASSHAMDVMRSLGLGGLELLDPNMRSLDKFFSEQPHHAQHQPTTVPNPLAASPGQAGQGEGLAAAAMESQPQMAQGLARPSGPPMPRMKPGDGAQASDQAATAQPSADQKGDWWKDFSTSPWALLTQAGLKTMAGKSPFAAENIGAGTSSALEDFGKQKQVQAEMEARRQMQAAQIQHLGDEKTHWTAEEKNASANQQATAQWHQDSVAERYAALKASEQQHADSLIQMGDLRGAEQIKNRMDAADKWFTQSQMLGDRPDDPAKAKMWDQKKSLLDKTYGSIMQGGGQQTRAAPPPLSMLKPGGITSFANGTKWRVGANGQPEQVQ